MTASDAATTGVSSVGEFVLNAEIIAVYEAATIAEKVRNLNMWVASVCVCYLNYLTKRYKSRGGKWMCYFSIIYRFGVFLWCIWGYNDTLDDDY